MDFRLISINLGNIPIDVNGIERIIMTDIGIHGRVQRKFTHLWKKLAAENDKIIPYVVPYFCLDSVECIGILKLRRRDLEDEFQVSTTKRRCRSKSLGENLQLRSREEKKARLVFRAILLTNCGTIVDSVQVASDPIICCESSVSVFKFLPSFQADLASHFLEC